MATDDAVPNPLVSEKAPETPLTVQLHPLALLTISDYITRHVLRRQDGPIVGAAIGQQNGRNLTIEHAYECLLARQQDGQYLLDPAFFTERLEQYKEVHKEPQLELVALFMLGPIDGPRPEHLPILQQTQKIVGSDAVLLLLFHPEMVDQQEGGKLPITLYEPFEMQLGERPQTRFLERSFDVETGEAEMIGMDFVAKGGGNATAVASQTATSATDATKDKKSKGKGKVKGESEEGNANAAVLSAEDEELISSLTARANAIKMLHQRLVLIRAYLSSLPKTSLTQTDSTLPPPPDTNFTLLRTVQSLLSRLPLLEPHHHDIHSSELAQAVTLEREDVHLTSLLASLTQSVAEAQSLGSKFADVQRERSSDKKSNAFTNRLMQQEEGDVPSF